MAEIHLTEAQRAAVETRGGAILVSAAAGSGKTRVLVKRLMRWICDPEQPHDVDEFLVITFTKKAAAELRARIAQELTERLAEDPDNRHLQKQLRRIYLAKISTVDSFCSDLLHEYAYHLDLPADFRQAEESELEVLRQKLVSGVLDDAYQEEGAADELRLLAEMLGSGRDDQNVASLILTVYREMCCHLSGDDWISFCLDALDTDGPADASETRWGRYLLDQLNTTAQDLLDDFKKTAGLLETDEALSKSYLPAFLGDIELLQGLAHADTWDAAAACRGMKFNGFKAPAKDHDEELKQQAKAIHDLAKDKITRLLDAFYAPSCEIFAELSGSAPALRRMFLLVREFASRFTAEKERLHIQDFSDLEHGAVRLLLQRGTHLPTGIARELSERFTEIMVDEYQDTNEIQDAIFRAISKDGKNRFMVGDVKQSIYRFRLADPTIFLKKYAAYRDYRQAADGESRKILLSENFRSGKEVLDAVNAVFTACMSEQVGELVYGEEESLKAGRPHPELPYTPVELHCISTSGSGDEDSPEKRHEEAAFVAARIRRLLDEGTPVRDGEGLRPVAPDDIVILLRTVKDNAVFYLDALRAQGIPAVCESGANILQSEELELLVSLLQVLDNAHRDIPLAAVLLSPVFGFTADALAKIRAQDDTCDLYDAVCAAAAHDDDCRRFLETVEALRTAAQELPLHTLLEKIDRLTGIEAVFGAMPDAESAAANFRYFRDLASSFERSGRAGLREFLSYLDMLEKRGGVSAGMAEKRLAVSVMSIHSSKGLEFPVVFLPDLSRAINIKDASAAVLLHPQFGAASTVADPATSSRYSSAAKRAIAERILADLRSEALRVLYVAMTRAQDLLIMSYCASNLKGKLEKLSTRLLLTDSRTIAKDAACLGDWVLLAALQRTEAGALFNFAQLYPPTSVSEYPWVITLQEHSVEAPCAAQEAQVSVQAQPTDLRMMQFRYAAPLAVQVPSKITATQLKGRTLDNEIAEGTPASAPVHFRQPPLFLEDRPLTAAERGTAAHLAMQYLDFAKTGSVEELEGELRRLVRDAFLTQKQADAVSPEKLFRIFDGPVGAMLRNADRVIREFKFSLLVDASLYFPAEPGEQMILQGVTDCCVEKDGALTVIDFKTDRVTAGTETESAERYRPQLEAYSMALSRIFGMPVEKRILYYFQTDTAVEI